MDVPVITVDNKYVLRKEQMAADSFNEQWTNMSVQCQLSTSPTRPWEETCLQTARVYTDAWRRACHQALVPFTEFKYRLHRLHRPNQSFTHTVFRSHLNTLTSIFFNFANQLPDFKQLSLNDQTELLDSNVALFIQYFLARYYYGGSRFKKAQWLLLSQVSTA